MPRDYFDHDGEQARRDESAFNRDASLAGSYDDEANREIGALLVELERRQTAGIDAEIDWVAGKVIEVGAAAKVA